ncbi:MAG: hypothetical protein ABIN94_22675 [Ferruginibacter sp.]
MQGKYLLPSSNGYTMQIQVAPLEQSYFCFVIYKQVMPLAYNTSYFFDAPSRNRG